MSDPEFSTRNPGNQRLPQRNFDALTAPHDFPLSSVVSAEHISLENSGARATSIRTRSAKKRRLREQSVAEGLVQTFHEEEETRLVSAGLCSEHGIPDIRRPVLFDAEPSEFELAFPDPVHEFDAGDGDRGGSEPFQAERWTQAKLDRSMSLFNEIIEAFRRSDFGLCAASMLCEDFTRRSMRRLIAVERDFVWQATSARERPAEKRFGGGDVSLGPRRKSTVFPALSTAR